MPVDDPLTDREKQFREVMYDPRNGLKDRGQKRTRWQVWCATARAEFVARELSAGTLIRMPDGTLRRNVSNPVTPSPGATSSKRRAKQKTLG